LLRLHLRRHRLNVFILAFTTLDRSSDGKVIWVWLVSVMNFRIF
jgi:hypothetical protein